MKCSVCYEGIENSGTKLFGRDICQQCMKCMVEIEEDNIFYDFYKERVKNIIKENYYNK